jgi:hypothetical protein
MTTLVLLIALQASTPASYAPEPLVCEEPEPTSGPWPCAIDAIDLVLGTCIAEPPPPYIAIMPDISIVLEEPKPQWIFCVSGPCDCEGYYFPATQTCIPWGSEDSGRPYWEI